MNNQFYMIKTTEEFRGYVERTITDKDGILYVDHTSNLIPIIKGDLSLQQYRKLIDSNVKAIDQNDLNIKLSDYYESYMQAPKEVTKEQYWNALEVLPPGRWANGWFFVIERITGNLVDWYADIGDKYYTFVDYDTASYEHLNEKLKNHLRGKHND